MAIIYSYPSETNIQSTDLLVGTSTVTQNGVNENVTRSFSVGNLAAYMNTIITSITSITFTAPLTGGTITQTGTVGITKATDSTNGYLSFTDWNTFNNKFDGQSGTTGNIPVFNSPTTLANSSLTDVATGVFSTKPFSPLTNAATDLGITGTNAWRNLFLSGTANAVNFTGTNLTLTGTLSANGSTGTDGFILQSKGAGAARWVDLSSAYDTYNLNAGTKAGTSVPLNLTSTSGGDNSLVNITEGTNITLTRTQQSLDEQTLTINSTDQFQGTVTGVTTNTPSTILVAGVAGVTPTLSTVTTLGVSAGATGLATGGQIKTAIDDALVGFLEFKSGFDAATGAIDGGGNLTVGGTRVAIAIGDFYVVTTAGDFYGDVTEPLAIGDQVICRVDAAVGTSDINDWVKVQQNIGVATATTLGIANFPTAGGLTVAAGAVSAKSFASVAIAGNAGYVPDSTAAAANTFLAKDGTWTVGPASGVSNITFNTGLTGGTISAGGSTVTVDYSTATNVILASGADTTAIIDSDTFLFGTGNNVGYGVMSALKTYIGAGAGTVTGSGTQYTIPVWNNGAGTAIGDSMIAQDAGGSIATVTGALTTTGLVTGANLTSQGTLITTTITDSASSTGTNGQVLTAGASGGAVTWGAAAASYTSWNLAGDSGTPIAITDTTTANIKGSAAASNAGIVTVVGATPATGTITISLVGQATATATNFYRGDGTFAAIPSSAPTRTVNRTTAGSSTNSHICGTVSQTNVNFIDVYVAGVYQNKDLYTAAVASGVTTITLTSGTYPNGVIIESVTTT